MGKFMNAKFNSTCPQTKKEIKKGDHIYYVPGRGAFHEESKAYKDQRASNMDSDMVNEMEHASFDRFCQTNNI